MDGLRKVDQVAASIAWTVVATVLFTGFLWVLAARTAHVGQAVGLWGPSSVELAEHVFRAAMGMALLGLSRLYRKLDERENSGSVAGWLSGWVLVLFSLASMLSLAGEGAAPVALLVVLTIWTIVKLARYFAVLDSEEEDQRG